MIQDAATAQHRAWHAPQSDMIRIGITQAAFDAIVATMPFGNVGYEPQRGRGGASSPDQGGWVDKVKAMRRAGEDLSDVIVRIAAVGAGGSLFKVWFAPRGHRVPMS